MPKKIKIVQTKSSIGYNKKTKATIEALGLKRINSPIIVKDDLSIRGMIDKVKHLVKLEELQ